MCVSIPNPYPTQLNSQNTHITGTTEIRIGADIHDYASPLCVSCEPDASYESKIDKAVNLLIGSGMYLRDCKLWIIPAVSLNWRSQEEQIMWNLMQKYEVMAVGVAPAGVPALLKSGSTTGVVVEMGENFTFIEPIYDGQLLHAHRFLPLGGAHISKQLRRHLEGRGYGLPENVVEDMKKKHCIVALNSAHARNLPTAHHKLDEKTTIKLSGKIRSKCCEVLFNPALGGKMMEGLPMLIHECIFECPIDCRKALMQNIFLVGGVAATPGMAQRVEKELKEIESSLKVVVRTPASGDDANQSDKTKQEITQAQKCRWAMYQGSWQMMMSDDYISYTDKTFCLRDDIKDMSQEQAMHVFESLAHVHQM